MTDPLVPPATGAQPASPAPSARSPLSDGEWHRLHPLTPLLRGGLTLLVVAGVVIANLRDRLIAIFLPIIAPGAGDYADWEGEGDPIDWIIANDLYLGAGVIVLAVMLVLVGLFYLSWRFHSFRITEDDVEVRSGVLFRTQRRAPLDRVQGVNLVRPAIARLLGMAKLEVVGAGTDGNVKLEYLSTANAEAVRADILRLASGRRLADAAAAAAAGGSRSRAAALSETVSRGLTGIIEGDEAPVAEPESVVDIPVGRLIASQVVSVSTVLFVVGLVAVAIAATFGVEWILLAYIPALIGIAAYWVRSTLRSLRYSIAPTPDGVRITFGLLTTITEIVPPGRVHAVEVEQPILWRPFGWWKIRINRLSGRSLSDGNTDQFTTTLPVGTAADVERVLRLLQPGVSEEEWALLVREGVLGTGDEDSFTTSPERAWFLRPLSRKRNGFLLTDVLLVLRRGFIWRKLVLLPLARLQSFGVRQGPVDRLVSLASVRGHIVSGPVYPWLGALDRGDALALFDAVRARAVRAAEQDRSHRWAEYDEAPSVLSAEQPPSDPVGAVPVTDAAAPETPVDRAAPETPVDRAAPEPPSADAAPESDR